MQPSIYVYPDKGTLGLASAGRTLLTIQELLTQLDTKLKPIRDRVDVILTGGSDSILSLKLMQNNPLTDCIDWKRVHFWWGDERFVPQDSENRNCLQARRAFLQDLVNKGDLPESNIHEIPADTRTAQEIEQASDEENQHLVDEAAKAYAQTMVQELGEQPSFDLAILGMGPDGHYGSLFPNYEHIHETTQLTAGVIHSPKMPPLRVTMTAPVLARSLKTWFMIAGQDKSKAFHGVMQQQNNFDYPASFANGIQEYCWMITRDVL
ncbi:MAG: 6-phosphogluconolactonase [Bifidobacteriaceae bacterium]|nr:6-phosphogluconolactonase [Bifidobacteriaceae bacterium]